MAFDHATAGDDAGKLARIYYAMNNCVAGGAAHTTDDIPQLRSEFEGVFDDDAVHLKLMTRGNAVLDAWWNAMQNLKRQWLNQVVKPWFFLWMREQSDLDSTAVTVRDIIGDWYDQMTTDSKVVLENSVTLSTPTAGANNTGDGKIFISKTDIWGNDNESIQNENFLFTCIADVPNNRKTAGQEQFSWAGSVHGAGPRLTCANTEGTDQQYRNRIDNGDFEAFTVANTPDDWDVDAGVVGVNIFEDATAFRGSKCLELLGSGIATIQISQSYANFVNYSTSKLEPKGVYMLSAAVKTSGCGSAESGDLTIQLVGTGISNSATTDIIISLDGDDTPPTSFTIYNRRIQLPKAINADTELVIKITDTFPAGNYVFIDNVVLAKMVEWPAAGVFGAAVAGGTDFIAGNKQPDLFTAAATNDNAGLIQSFLTRKTDTLDPGANEYPGYGIHLPSDSSASAEYAETKAQ